MSGRHRSAGDGAHGLASALAGTGAVAVTYVSFLLWAQFGFLALLSERVSGSGAVRLVMTVMGVAGLMISVGTAPVLSFAGRRLSRRWAARAPVVAGLAASAVAPLLALGCRGLAGFAVVAGLVGGATAFLTVSLAANLRELVPLRRPGLAVGAATGVAYFVCNLPGLFDAPPAVQAMTVAALCTVAALLLAGTAGRGSAEATSAPYLPERLFGRLGLAAAALSFLLLVGLDSAVFVIVQETPGLKEATWSADGGTLLQGAVHLVAATAAGALVDIAGGQLFGALLVLTGGLFAGGFGLLGGGPPPLLMTLGGVLYAVGISIYSVALVLYPAGRGDAPGLVPARWRSALVYGVAGWLGSALGVGMAQDLHRIPAGLPETTVAVLAAVWGVWWLAGRRRTTPSGAERSEASSHAG
jgi:cytochrome c oxidase cbb3-type subunit 2